MPGTLETLVASLLYEGYCLYPYTPGSVKNATPTPFGIIYPPGYASRHSSTFDHLQIECVLQGSPEALLKGAAVFLQANGDGHRAAERRIECPARTLISVADDSHTVEFSFVAESGLGVNGRAILSVVAVAELWWRARLRIENLTAVDDGAAADMDRRAALERSLLSTHALVEVSGGRFVSPLERGGPAGRAVADCRNVNSWPVLATPLDDAVLGAAIFLPDHPQIAPESKVNFFDNTEIEEALMLHVQVLSDAEREAIGGGDAAVLEMVERAAAASPEERLRQHGMMKPVDEANRIGNRHG